jgi:hypothetical protein
VDCADNDWSLVHRAIVGRVAGYGRPPRRGGRVILPVARRMRGAEALDAVPTRGEGIYWVVLGQNPPKIAYWERGEWWLAGDAKPWQPEAITVVSERLIF